MAIPDGLTPTQLQPAQETGARPAKVIDAETPLPMDTGRSMRFGSTPLPRAQSRSRWFCNKLRFWRLREVRNFHAP